MVTIKSNDTYKNINDYDKELYRHFFFLYIEIYTHKWDLKNKKNACWKHLD